MSKKNKAKFKKQIKAELLNQLSKNESSSPVINLPSENQSQNKQVASPAKDELGAIQNLHLIKYDLKKTAIVIGSLAVIIAGLAYFDQKSDILLKTGNLLFKVLNIN